MFCRLLYRLTRASAVALELTALEAPTALVREASGAWGTTQATIMALRASASRLRKSTRGDGAADDQEFAICSGGICGVPHSVIPCIRSSALSRDTRSLYAEQSFVLSRNPFPLSTKARSFPTPKGAA